MINILGERFDLHRLGEHVLLQIPRGAAPADALLRVVGRVENLDSAKCTKEMWFRHLSISGSWVGTEPVTFDTEDGGFNAPGTVSMSRGGAATTPELFKTENPNVSLTVELMANGTVAPTIFLHRAVSRKAILNVSQVQFHVQWATSLIEVGLMNYLDFQIHHLQTVEADIGGLLGVDSHQHASTFSDVCLGFTSQAGASSGPFLASVVGAYLD